MNTRMRASAGRRGQDERSGSVKKFLMLLAVAYVPGMLMTLSALFAALPPEALFYAIVSVIYVPWFTGWAVIGILYDTMGWFSQKWEIVFSVAAYLLFIAAGSLFIIAKKRTVRWTAFAIYTVMVLLSLYGFAWFCSSHA